MSMLPCNHVRRPTQFANSQQRFPLHLCIRPVCRCPATGRSRQSGPPGASTKPEQQGQSAPPPAQQPPAQQQHLQEGQQHEGQQHLQLERQQDLQQDLQQESMQQEGVQQPQPTKTAQPAEQEQLWWVEKFEEKRKALEQQQPSLSSSSSSSSKATTQHGAAATNPAAAAAAGNPIRQPPPAQHIPWPKLLLQLLQLTAAVSALILWPASLYRTGLYSGKVWLLFCTYVLFFGGGSVWRLVQFGPLASRKKDQQAKALKTRAAWVLFVAMMPVLHWGAVGSFMKARAKAAAAAAAAAQQGFVESGYTPSLMGALTLYDVIGLGLLVGAVWLNWLAARHLGRAYDRVVKPEALVTSGPYAKVQHPIYSSYMMLFCAYAMLLHSFGYALLALVVCLVYYKSRVALEAAVLQEAFGDKYAQYQHKTKLFVPLII